MRLMARQPIIAVVGFILCCDIFINELIISLYTTGMADKYFRNGLLFL